MLKKYNCTLLHFNKMIKLYIESKVSHKKVESIGLEILPRRLILQLTLLNLKKLHCAKQSFPLRISSVNVTKSAKNWSYLTKKFLMEKLHFLCSASTIDN